MVKALTEEEKAAKERDLQKRFGDYVEAFEKRLGRDLSDAEVESLEKFFLNQVAFGEIIVRMNHLN